MAESKINMRRLAVVLMGMAVAVAAITLVLMKTSTKTEPNPKILRTSIRADDSGRCRNVLDLVPGRRFSSYSRDDHIEYIVTQPMGQDDAPRELTIERIDQSFMNSDCLFVLREHRIAELADAGQQSSQNTP